LLTHNVNDSKHPHIGLATMGTTALDYLSLIGLSAIVGAGVSTVLNYFFDTQRVKKQNQIRLIESKLDLFSFIIFHLDKMRFHGDAIKERSGIRREDMPEEVYSYSGSKDEFNEIVTDINDKIKDRYYLFRQKILKEWTYVNTSSTILDAALRLPELRKMIVTEYNDVIVPEYDRLTGKKIDKIS
jgi:hypothetical protein